MSDEALIRSYIPSDLAAIEKIHNENSLDYSFPNLNSSLFLVNKVLEINGEVKASYALRVVVEANLWLDKRKWADAEQKWAAIKSLDREATLAAKELGVDGMTCVLPPGYERFGRRISGKDGLGYKKGRSGWTLFHKHAGDQK